MRPQEAGLGSDSCGAYGVLTAGGAGVSLPSGGEGVGCLQLHVCDLDLPLSFGVPP